MELPYAHPYTASSDALAESLNTTKSGLKTPKNMSAAHIQPGQQHPKGCQHAATWETPPAGTPNTFTESRSHGKSQKPKAGVVDEHSLSFLSHQALPAGWAEAAQLRRS